MSALGEATSHHRARLPVAPVAERRVTGRAKNVARLPVKTGPKAVAKPMAVAAAGAKAGSDGDWSQF